MSKITKRVVDAAVPKPDRYIIWDEEIKGFGLLVMPSGIKSYFYQYRTAEGRQRRATIGKHGEWTPPEARAKAEDHREVVRAGRDPLADKRALKDAPTVGETIDAYLASESFKVKAISTQRVDKGHRAAPATTTGQETRSLAQKRRHQANLQLIREGSTAKDEKTRKRGRARVTGGPGTARMAIELLRSIFNWANVKPNPCDGVKTGSSGTRETILEDSDGYRRLFATLDRMETERRIRFAGCRCHTPHSAYGLSSGRSGGVALGECRFEAGAYPAATAIT